jgi:uncharacterized membrane protein YgcG
MGVRGIGRVAVIAVLVVLVSASPAWASPTGQITRASTNAEGTLGSFAGFVAHDGSGCTDPCHWRGLMTIQPWTTQQPLYPCNAENWSYPGDPSVQVIWDSGDQTTFHTVTFDSEDFPILDGVEDQRLCLYIAYTSTFPGNYTCAPSDPYCPSGASEEQFDLYGHATFTVQVSGGSGGGGSGGGGGTGGGTGGGGTGGHFGSSPPVSTQPVALAVLSKKLATSRAKAALARKYRRAYKRGKKRVSCKRRSSREYRCSFRLRYRKKKFHGTVSVRATADGIKATVTSRR